MRRVLTLSAGFLIAAFLQGCGTPSSTSSSASANHEQLKRLEGSWITDPSTPKYDASWGRGYHFLANIKGDELVLTSIRDTDEILGGVITAFKGDETPLYRLKLNGRKVTGLRLPRFAVTGGVSEDFDKLHLAWNFGTREEPGSPEVIILRRSP
jgi:hypothetical protein